MFSGAVQSKTDQRYHQRRGSWNNGTAQAQLFLTPSPGAQADASSALFNDFEDALARVQYDFQFTGPAGAIPVDFDINEHVSVFGTAGPGDSAFATVSFSMNDVTGDRNGGYGAAVTHGEPSVSPHCHGARRPGSR